MIKLTLFTPTYNRAKLLSNLYHSLQRQSSFDFEWLIVDDGSSDGTDTEVSKWLSEDKFKIRYYKKANGGKHTAINLGVELAHGQLFFIVDSDDTITNDAVEVILTEWEKVKNLNLCGMVFLKGKRINGTLKSLPESVFPKDNVISNIIKMKYNRGTSADSAEVWVTDCMRKHPFSVYPNEKFMSEGMVWIRMSKEQDMLFRNKIIYICDYLEGGLTKLGKKLRFQCPKGGIEGSLETMSSHFNLKMRIKQTLLYIVYSKFDGRKISEILNCQYKLLVSLCLPIGYTLYHYWKYKYFRNE